MSIINIDTLKQFLESQYARHLIFKTDNLEVLLVCWLPGQSAEIHDHGNSDAITLILEGQMAHTTYYPDGTKVSGILQAGDIEHIPVGVKHEVINNSNQKLITLHIYSPPLDVSLLSTSLGYANKVRFEELQLLEKKIRYLTAEKPAIQLSYSKSITGDLKNKYLRTTSTFTSEKPKQITIAIIGGGFSGTLVATQLMRKQSNVPLQIMLIERAPKFARGFAYSTNSPMHLLNVPAGKMSAFPNDSEHFLKWAQNRDPNIKSETFVPRMLYGEYLETVLYEAEANKSTEIKFKRLNDEAALIEPLPNDLGAIVHLQSGIQLPTNFIVLAVGNYLPRNPGVTQTSFYKSKKYVRDPWSANSLSMISPDAPVLLIGTGLTMIDKAIELKCRGHRGTIYSISRHGLLPQPHNLDIKQLKIDFEFKEPLSIKSLLKLIRQEVKSIERAGGNWRQVIDTLRPHVQRLWSLLPSSEKERFFRHVRPYWDIHRHRMPPQVATVINSMLESKQLLVYTGRIKNYEEKGNHVNVIIQERNSPNLTTIQVSRVINCTGSEVDFCQVQDPLIISLLEQGLIVPDKLSLGLEANSQGALKDKYGNTSKTLYTLGPPLKGRLWETTAVPEIREQAFSLGEEIMKEAISLYNEQVLSKSNLDKEQLVNEFNYVI